MEVRQVNISDSAAMKQEVAKATKQSPTQETNLKQNPTLEQTIFQRPYGADGAAFGKAEQYNPLSTILPESKMEEARRKLKEEDEAKKRRKKKKEQKKQGQSGSFWSWLTGSDEQPDDEDEGDD